MIRPIVFSVRGSIKGTWSGVLEQVVTLLRHLLVSWQDPHALKKSRGYQVPVTMRLIVEKQIHMCQRVEILMICWNRKNSRHNDHGITSFPAFSISFSGSLAIKSKSCFSVCLSSFGVIPSLGAIEICSLKMARRLILVLLAIVSQKR